MLQCVSNAFNGKYNYQSCRVIKRNYTVGEYRV